jgi:glyceraldehyde-3-phosphate dehydrogenase (NADP+)
MNYIETFRNIYDEDFKFKNLMNGEWVISESNKLTEIKSPIDNRVLGYVQGMCQSEVDQAIKFARESQKLWQDLPMNKRADILYKAADLIIEYEEELAEFLVLEIAKDYKSSLREVRRTADFIRFTADASKQIHGEAIPGDSFPGSKRNKISFVSRVPLGVVLAISPFNYPINLAASKVAPALVAGNSVVFKPATQGSISGLFLAEIFNRAGLPKGVLNTVTGRGSEIGDYVVTHPGIDFINFTGSTEVGQHISSIVGMKPVLLELGGKDAAIVLEDADLDLAADNIISGGYSYSGQRCTAVKRILVLDSIADQLSNRVQERIKSLKTGDPRDKGNTIGPLINDKAADYVMELIEDAKDNGANLLAGGNRNGRMIEPTLFDNVPLSSRLAWEEPFGPVLPIIRVKSIEEAIEIANKSDYGLQSSIFTQNIDKAFYIAEKLEVGTVQINNKPERGPDHFPFLGVKSSGMGTQGIRYSIEAMTRIKATVINLHNDK